MAEQPKVIDEEPQAEVLEPEPVFAVPDMIRVLGGGQIGVDEERWLHAHIPSGTPFYSEAVVAKLQDELAEARELATSFRQAAELPPATADRARPEVNVQGFLMALPMCVLLRLTQSAINCLTMRQLSEVCYDNGITPSFRLEDSHD